MKNFSITQYQETDYDQWNDFIGKAKNATFLFHRDFMEYHKDRFKDFSLIVKDNNKWVAVLPANIVDSELYSHQGLTYGGLVYLPSIGAELVEVIFDKILDFLSESNIPNLTLKLMPDFYKAKASSEMNYFLFQKKASLINRSMNLVIDYSKPLEISKSKLKHFKRVSELGISIIETDDFTSFWNQILIPRLREKYNASPVHTLEEMHQLKLKFPLNIKQINAYFDGEIVAGITLFIAGKIVKSQYGATTLKGEGIRALDYLFINLIKKYQSDFSCFDMGIVDDHNSYNKGLLKQKEELGCSVYTQDVYKVQLQ